MPLCCLGFAIAYGYELDVCTILMESYVTKSFQSTLAALVFGLALTSPAYADDGQLFSTLLGASLGGWAGSYIGHGSGRLAATGAGVFLGGAIGNELGRPSSYAYARPSYAYSYPEPVYYYAPYRPTYVAPPEPAPQPVTYVDDESGSYCREYSQQIRIGNHVQESYGTACLQPDGSWHIVR